MLQSYHKGFPELGHFEKGCAVFCHNVMNELIGHLLSL